MNTTVWRECGAGDQHTGERDERATRKVNGFWGVLLNHVGFVLRGTSESFETLQITALEILPQ